MNTSTICCRRSRLGRIAARIAILLLFVFSNFQLFAQGQTVNGTVKEADGSPLPGATVQIKGTTRGTQTDVGGAYTIPNVPASSTLVFSFIGKTVQEIAVGNRTTVDATLIDDSKSLQEVVVVGYGSQRRQDVTGAIASISSADFQKGNIVNPEQLVAGKLAGVSITPPSGQPGGGSQIRIRGGSSLNASNDPLYVIDGVPLDNTGISGAANALSFINPQDIETFTVLKDASAAAIYGARAANGVILITTKKGRQGEQFRLNFSALSSLSVNSKLIPVISADEYRNLINTNTTLAATPAQQALVGTANTNWQKEIYRPAVSGDFNLSGTGSYKNTPYRVSLGYLTQNGVLKTSHFDRFSGAIGLTPKFFNNSLSVDINLKGSIIQNRFANQGAIGAAVAFDPTQPVYSGRSSYGGYYEWTTRNDSINTQATRNPVGLLMQRNDDNTVRRSFGNAVLNYRLPFLPDLRANLNLGYDISSTSGRVSVPATAGEAGYGGGTNNQYSQKRNNKTLEFYLNYVRDLKRASSRLDVTAGYSYQDFIRDEPSYASLRATPIVVDQATGRQSDTVSAAGVPFRTQYTLIAFFGRVNYTFKDRYVLTATVREDATSRFAPNVRWGTFPSLAFAWNVKEESFLKTVKAFSVLKFRAGYGITGQQDLPTGLSDYPYLPRYTLGDPTAQYQFGSTYYRTLRAEGYDANIKWEQTEAINVGIDFGFFSGRLSGSIDLYQKNTSNLLSTIPVPAGSNLTNQILTNVGNLTNKGVEFQINATPYQAEGVNVDVGFNITYNQNRITNLSKVPTPSDPGILVGTISGGTGNTVQIQTVGYSTNTFYLYRQVFNEQGQPVEGLYEDRNADGRISIDDRYRSFSANPKVLLGFTTQLTLRNLTAGFVLRGNIGNYVYNNVRSNNGAYRNFTNSLGFLSNGVQNALTTNFVNNQYFSDYYLENGSFLRLDNLNIGYDFGRLARKYAFRASLTAQNLFVITKYTGLDPEIAGGIDNNFYPRPRIISLGINLGL